MEQNISKILSEVDYVQFQFTNILGQLKAVEVPKRLAEKYLEEGLGIDGSSIGFLLTEQSDMRIKPDLSTLQIIPWDTRAARVICDIYDLNERPLECDPRSILKRAINSAKIDFNFDFKVRPELEWYVMSPDGEPADIGEYMDAPPHDSEYELRREIVDYMMELGTFPKMLHHEVGPGQMEIEFEMTEPLLAADMVQTTKQIIKMVAWNNGLVASFMPKPYTTEAGNGLHVHHMLFKNNENIFSAKGGVSQTLKYFVGGLLKHAPGLTAIFNPTINSYKRIVPDHEAPVYISWGIANRTALVRVPGYEKTARIEYRGADTTANIYLLTALLLVSGLDGIRNKIEPIEGTSLNVDRLTNEKREEMGIRKTPSTLKAAIEALNADKFLCDFLGPAFIEIYNKIKRNEWEAYTKHVKNPESIEVSEWEFNEMFERI
ncbi:MAG TPA: glutamine synthetase family protein [Candidatus Bathyarchaeia archaeon]|nr:glutamine synthetase family protein [Candidatus Bathyarchaeia archaeon]